jgi:hypothetical protein
MRLWRSARAWVVDAAQRIRLRGLRPVEVVAAVLLVIAATALVVGLVSDVADNWMPNVATEAFFVAVAVTVIDGAIRRQAAARLRPRVERVIEDLRWAFRRFADGVIIDYAGTHLHRYRSVPRDVLTALDQWLEDSDQHDACPLPLPEETDRLPLVVHQGFEFANALRALRESDREVMEPEVVRAIDDFLWLGEQHSRLSLSMSRGPYGVNRADSHRHAEEAMVRAARAFGGILLRHDERGRIQFDELAVTAMAQHNAMARQPSTQVQVLIDRARPWGER